MAAALAVMPLDQACPARQLQHVGLAEGEAVALLQRHIHVASGAVLAVHHPDRLAAEPLAHDRRKALLERRFEDQVFVGVHGPLHHVLPEPIGRREQHGVAEAGFGVDAEHHPGAGLIGAHHALHADGEGHLEVIEAVDLPVGDGPIGEQGGEAAPAGRQQRLLTFHIQIGLLLPGERGIGQVFSRSARAHGYGRCPQLAVGVDDRLF
jgi:hypothetical protein